MLDYRNILRVASDPHKSMRTMELELRSSHHTIRKVLDAAEKAGISWPLPENVTNEMLIELLFPEEYQKTVLYAVPDYAYIHGELAKKGVNLTILWEEYSAKCQTEGSVPYMYSYFCEKYGRWANVTKATMRIQHKPGDTMEVDWAGAALDIHNSVTGEVSKAYLFVAVLPCSCFTYAEVCDDMKLENWISCHIHTYNYFSAAGTRQSQDRCYQEHSLRNRPEPHLSGAGRILRHRHRSCQSAPPSGQIPRRGRRKLCLYLDPRCPAEQKVLLCGGSAGCCCGKAGGIE